MVIYLILDDQRWSSFYASCGLGEQER